MMEHARQRLAELVATATDGAVSAGEALSAGVPLTSLGMTSLAQMRLIDAVESEFGVEIDLAGDGMILLDDFDKLSDYVTR
jgi:acyl carrier protein